MSIRKISLQPLQHKGQLVTRTRSCQHQKQPIKSSFYQKRPPMSIGHSRKPSSIYPPRLAPLNSLPVSSSKKQLQRRSISVKHKNQKDNFDQQIITGCRSKSNSRPMRLQGMSQQALFQRKESHLNTYFNIRKNRLKEITKVNRQIYVRINSQKSLYSSRKLDSSSNSLANSRSSNASNASMKSRKSMGRGATKPIKALGNHNKQPIQIVEKKIDKMEVNDMGNYLKVFCSDSRRNVKSSKNIQKEPKIQLTLQGKENCGGSALEQIIQEFGSKHRQRVRSRLPY